MITMSIMSACVLAVVGCAVGIKPWMNPTGDPITRAKALVAEMNVTVCIRAKLQVGTLLELDLSPTFFFTHPCGGKEEG